MLMVIIFAEKTEGPTSDLIPIQADYRPESHKAREGKDINYRRGLMAIINNYAKGMSDYARKHPVLFYIPCQSLSIANSLNTFICDIQRRRKPKGYKYLGKV